MRFESKYDIGQVFVFGEEAAFISEVIFSGDNEPSYKLRWNNPFTHISDTMRESELMNTVLLWDKLKSALSDAIQHQ